jgi:hypothetical protein
VARSVETNVKRCACKTTKNRALLLSSLPARPSCPSVNALMSTPLGRDHPAFTGIEHCGLAIDKLYDAGSVATVLVTRSKMFASTSRSGPGFTDDRIYAHWPSGDTHVKR